MNNLIKQWDSAAEKIDSDPMRLVRYAMAMRYLKSLPKNAAIIDIGCGEGGGLRFFQDHGYSNLYGIEVSPERISRTLFRSENLKIRHVSPENSEIPFHDGSFDAAISMGVIEHTKDPLAFIKELARVTKPFANVVVSSDGFAWRILQLLGLYRSVQPIDKTMTFKKFKDLFNQAGFVVKHFDTFEWSDRGNVLRHYLTPAFLRKDCLNQGNSETISSILKSEPDFSTNFLRRKTKMNWFYDENIFLLEKTG